MSRVGRLKITSHQSEFIKQDTDIFAGLDSLLSGKPLPVKHTSTGLVSLEQAPNAVIFIESEHFLAGPTLFPVQYQIVRDFFELLCPHCNDFDAITKQEIDIASDLDKFNTFRKTQTLFEYGVCPKCGLRRLDISDQLHLYNELIGVLGMRSGKSALTAAICAALLHEYLCEDNLQEKYGVIKRQELEGTFVASTGSQASETVWGQLMSLMSGSPWYQHYKTSLMNLEVTDPKYRRGSLFREGDTFIWWQDKNIRIQSGTSNSGGQAGRTRLFAVIDELSRFDAGDSKRSATEVYRVFANSLLTIRAAVRKLREKGNYTVPDAYLFCVSSPLFADDKSMSLLRQAESQRKMFAFRKATWEANPTITQDDLVEYFEKDPIGAERDYGVNPPGAESPFIKDRKIIELCIDKERPQMFSPQDVFVEKTVNGIRFPYISTDIGNIRYRNLLEYCIHCDPGKAHDSFCLAIGHQEENNYIIDGALEIKPIPKGNRQHAEPRNVYFPVITDIILKLNSLLSIRVVTYDRWNSEEQIQRLRDSNILAVSKDITRDDHVRLLRNMEAGRVRFPKREAENVDPQFTRNVPCAKALWELLRLNDNGVKVDHSSNGSNDMIQCYVGVHRILATPEEIFSKDQMKEQQRIQMVHKMRKGHSNVGRVFKLRW